ncbi:HD domain-containing protein [Tepidibacter aestuarii]|uniref:HD domain-containing protein n=1 Tax=Tepidibacter aestuarii TaxID=2925782 RepID=UPI0020BEA49A|nr:HD domain-containing protein [Tepidibacter aestuarii]CAH2214803.1 3'-5' exoribonuclease [Tepidibacter aestuarii]
MKSIFVKDINDNESFKSSFMIIKKLARREGTLIAFIGDKTGDVKAHIPDSTDRLEVGDVISVKATKDGVLNVQSFKKEKTFNIEEFLPSVERPIEDIMDEMNRISKEVFESDECRALDEYFFNDNKFVERFKKGIGGLSQHHNYLGGLAEHTLNSMYLAKIMTDRYNCRYKEIAILGAKLHDIGKIEEYKIDGPFSVTMRGDMEGHIVMGVTMLEEAFRSGGDIYSEDFKMRIKSCIIQHHGKLEYGSPKVPKTEEAFIVHYADYVDAMLNKIEQVRNITEPNNWSEYDRRIGTKLYM